MARVKGTLSSGVDAETDHVASSRALSTYLMDGSTVDMVVDGSTTPVVYSYTPPTGLILDVYRLLLYVDDSTEFSPSTFGDIAALTNGVTIKANGDLLETWRDNMDIITTMHDFLGTPNLGKSTSSGAGRWTFTKFGGPIRIVPGSTFSATINDAMAGLDSFRIKIQGRLIDV